MVICLSVIVYPPFTSKATGCNNLTAIRDKLLKLGGNLFITTVQTFGVYEDTGAIPPAPNAHYLIRTLTIVVLYGSISVFSRGVYISRIAYNEAGCLICRIFYGVGFCVSFVMRVCAFVNVSLGRFITTNSEGSVVTTINRERDISVY